MAKMYYEKDCDLSYLDGKKIAIIGYARERTTVYGNFYRYME